MSCITIPKTWGGAAAPRVEAVTPVMPAAIIQRRATKKARATPQLVDTVREVVQAFEFEYAQVRAESVEVKAVLNERKTQLSDLRQHLEKESTENGNLEAVVQHRNSKNDKGAARLRELEVQFTQLLADDSAIASRAAALESDLGVFNQDHRQVREKISLAASQLDRGEATILERERAISQSLEESERLDAAIQEGRGKVGERQCLSRSGQERAIKIESLAKEAAAEAKALEADTVRLRGEVVGKEAESVKASLGVEAIRLRATQTAETIGEEKTRRTQQLEAAQNRLVELRQQVDTREGDNVRLDERIRVVKLAVATKAEECEAKKAEIAAMEASRKQALQAEVGLLSSQLEAADAKVVEAEGAVGQASDRMRQANTEFSNLMAAMSSAFREYDQAITSKREVERGVVEAESTLATVRESSKRDLTALREILDGKVSFNATNRTATEVDRMQAEELRGGLVDAQKAVDEATSGVESTKGLMAASERRLEEGRSAKQVQEEARAKEIQAAREAEAAAQETMAIAGARLEQLQSELFDLRQQTAEWVPPPAVLHENDLQRADEEAAAAVTSMRAGDDKVHASRLFNLKETLTTIREGGAARLKADKDAAAARLAELQDQILEITMALADLRARQEIAKDMETAIAMEISRREEAEKRRAAEEEQAAAAATAAAAAAAASQEEQAAAAAAAQEKQAAAAATAAAAAAAAAQEEQAAAAAAAATAATAAAARATATAAAEATAAAAAARATAAAQAAATAAAAQASAVAEAEAAASAADAQAATVAEAAAAGAALSSFMTPQARATDGSSGGHPAYVRPAVRHAATTAQATTTEDAAASSAALSGFMTPQPRATNVSTGVHPPYARSAVRNGTQGQGRRPATTGGHASSFITPEVRSASRSCEVRPTTDSRTPRGSVRTPGYAVTPADSGLRDNSDDREVPARIVESAPHRSRGDRRSADPARRSKKSGRSSSKEPPARSQQASESTAEAAGSRKSVSSGRKHTSSSNGGNGSGRHKKKDKSATQVSSASIRASESGDGSRTRAAEEPRDRQGRAHTPKQRNSKSKSMSPRHRPKSPRPDNKEYDLWTDNRLVGDSDFSFF